MAEAERIVVVGHAAVTCLGRDMDTTWAGLVAGRSGLRRHASLPPEAYLQDIAGLVEDLRPEDDPTLGRLPARSLHLAMHAARAAWADAGLDQGRHDLDPGRVAIALGSAFGGIDFYDAEGAKAAGRKSLAVSPYLVPGLIANQAAGQVAERLGLHGPSYAPANACASGGHAVALGGLLLRAGEADLALCGAAEGAITPLIVNAFATMKALLPRRADDRSVGDPGQASRPFSVDRAGFIPSEGAGVLVLATESAARRLGLRVQAELLGWAVNSDGHHMALPSGDRIADCLALALKRSGCRPEEVDYYNAHGTSTVVNDKVEAQALHAVFGDRARRLPVSSIKGALGHALGAASAVEAAACVRALGAGLIPPTINHRPDPQIDLDVVPREARAARLGVVMSASFGFGGTNNALVFRRPRDA